MDELIDITKTKYYHKAYLYISCFSLIVSLVLLIEIFTFAYPYPTFSTMLGIFSGEVAASGANSASATFVNVLLIAFFFALPILCAINFLLSLLKKKDSGVLLFIITILFFAYPFLGFFSADIYHSSIDYGRDLLMNPRGIKDILAYLAFLTNGALLFLLTIDIERPITSGSNIVMLIVFGLVNLCYFVPSIIYTYNSITYDGVNQGGTFYSDIYMALGTTKVLYSVPSFALLFSNIITLPFLMIFILNTLKKTKEMNKWMKIAISYIPSVCLYIIYAIFQGLAYSSLRSASFTTSTYIATVIYIIIAILSIISSPFVLIYILNNNKLMTLKDEYGGTPVIRKKVEKKSKEDKDNIASIYFDDDDPAINNNNNKVETPVSSSSPSSPSSTPTPAFTTSNPRPSSPSEEEDVEYEEIIEYVDVDELEEGEEYEEIIEYVEVEEDENGNLIEKPIASPTPKK